MTFSFAPARPLAQALRSHDNGFNLVRLVCALLVVVYHAFQLNVVHPGVDPASALMGPTADLGSLAVATFFLLSGLFVSHSWLRDPHLGRFAARRVARILPGLAVCLLLTTLVAIGWFSTRGWAMLADWAPWRYMGGAALLHGLQYNIAPQELSLPDVLGGMALNGPLWTLYWEGRMYVMVALIGVAAVLPLRRWLRGAALFLLLAANLFPDVASGYVWEVRMWSMFLCGMLLATLAPRVRVGPVQLACALALLALNWTRSAALTPSPVTWFGLALAASAAALWVGSTGLAGLAHVRRHDYSFGVYIYHWPLLLLLRAALPPLDALPLLGVTLAVLLPVAALSWHGVEQPVLRAVRRRLARASAAH